MSATFTVRYSPEYLDDRDRFCNNPRALKELIRLEKRLSDEGTEGFKDLHRVGDDAWTVYAGEGRRLIIRKDGRVIELLRFGEHDDVYLEISRASPVPMQPPDPAPSQVRALPALLFADLPDDLLTRLGVLTRDLPVVRAFRWENDVYTAVETLGDDLAQRLLECLERPTAQVLAEYELRGRNDENLELLEQFETEARVAQEEAERAGRVAAQARADLESKSDKLASTRAALEAMGERDRLDEERVKDLESAVETLLVQVTLLAEAARRSDHASREADFVAAARHVPLRPLRAAPVPPRAQAPARRRSIRPGDEWPGARGHEKWRLSPSARSLTRLSDGLSLHAAIGSVEASRVVDDFLGVRPSGGRVWIDRDGNAVTVVDNREIYLGSVGSAQHAEAGDDGSLLSAVRTALATAPGSTAREIAFHLSRHGHPDVTRADVNALLYRERHTFRKDDAGVPRWHLAAFGVSADDSLPAVRPPKSHRTAKKSRDTYASLISAVDEIPVATPVAFPARPAELAPARVLDLLQWQKEAVAAWYANGCHGIVEAVTGTGKTHVGLEAVAHAAAMGEKATVLVPSIDLQDQWAGRFATFLPHLSVARLGGKASGRPETADVTIAVVNTAVKSDLSRFSAHSLIVADEVHRYGAEMYQLGLRPGYGRRLGLTATLERSDEAVESVLRPYFGGTRMTVGFERAIRDGIVAPFRLVMAPVEMTEDERLEYDELSQQISNGLKFLRSQGALGGDGANLTAQLNRLRGAGGRIGKAAQSAEAGMRKRRRMLAGLAGKLDAVEELVDLVCASQGSVLFTQSKEVAEEAALRLRGWDVAASALHSDMGTEERRSALKDLEDGKLQALAAPKLLDEGIDLPSVDVGVVMTASRSRRQMVQRLGRVIRRKPDGRHVDFVILYAADSVEDASNGVHEGFFDLVGDVAQNRLQLELGWTADDL